MNFRGILSKSSLKSSSSGKSLTHSEEISKLQSEIESLKETIDSLKISVESRDAAVGTLAREKEKIYVELKSSQRTNRNLHQQLTDERDIHSKEKEFLITELQRLSKQNEYSMNAQQNKDSYKDQTKNLFDELKAKDEVIYSIGAKYMKIKSSKQTLQKKFENLQVQNQKMCENIIFLLQDNRKTLDDLLENLLKSSTLSPNSKKYLNLLQINANLHYENIQLKIYMSAKDSTNILDFTNRREQPVKPCSIKEHSKSVIITEMEMKKQNDKVLKSRHQMAQSKLKSQINHGCPDLKTFKKLHQSFSPIVRGGFHRSISDSCILRRNLSEMMNISNIN